MKPHQRIAIALRVARTLGADVLVTANGATLHFGVPSPADARAVLALEGAGFRACTPTADGFAGWIADAPVPGVRATTYLVSLHGSGPLPSPPRPPRKPRTPKAPAASTQPAASPGKPAGPSTPKPAATHTHEVTVLRRVRRAA